MRDTTVSASARVRKRIGHVSTFPPIKCGIASFASDLINALPDYDHDRFALNYSDESIAWGALQANVNSAQCLVKLARTISASSCDVLFLQHEFGIWGGHGGENIHPFLDALNKPIITVMHTTFDRGSRPDAQSDILARLTKESEKVILLTHESERTLVRLVGGPKDKLVTIRHGVPDYPFVKPIARSADQVLRLVTPGFFREDKGFEAILVALKLLRDQGAKLSYRIVGEAQGQFEPQAAYRSYILNLIEELDLSSVVHVDNRYLAVSEQVDAIRKAHFGIFAYQTPMQSSSGTIPLVLSMGRPVICTPFEYASATAADECGMILTLGFDPTSIAEAIKREIQGDGYFSLARSAYEHSRAWTWSAVGGRFADVLSGLD